MLCRWGAHFASLVIVPAPSRRHATDTAADRRRIQHERAALAAATTESLDNLPFCLSKDEKQRCHEVMQTAKSTGLLRTELYSSSIWNMFGKSWACKTHDFVLLSGPVMMYALQDKLETRPREALSLLFEAISKIWSKTFQRSQLPKLQALLHKALLMTSIHFPAAQHDIIQHLMHHIVDGIEANGPPWASAMWAFERLWYVLISQNHSTKHPATSMMMNWRAERLADRLCERIDMLLSPSQVLPHAMLAMLVLLDCYCHVW